MRARLMLDSQTLMCLTGKHDGDGNTRSGRIHRADQQEGPGTLRGPHGRRPGRRHRAVSGPVRRNAHRRRLLEDRARRGGGVSAPTLRAVPLDADTARDLSRAAANVQTWTAKRNGLIRAAHAAGGGVREIARATGLNVATVHNIITPRKR